MRRLKLSWTLQGESRKRGNYPDQPGSLTHLQRAPKQADANKHLGGAGAAGIRDAGDGNPGLGSEGGGRVGLGAQTMSGEVSCAPKDGHLQAAASVQDGGAAGSRADRESGASSAEEVGVSREGSPAAQVAAMDGEQGAEEPGLVRPETVVSGSVPGMEAGPVAAGEAEEGKAGVAVAPKQITDYVVRPELLCKPVKVLFRGPARAQASRVLRQGEGGDAAEDEEMLLEASEASGKRSRPRLVEAAEPPAQRRRADTSSTGELPSGVADQSVVAEVPMRGGGVRGQRGGSRGSRGAVLRRRGADSGPLVVAPKPPAGDAELQHQRNVMHLLGPGLLADSGLGPAAVRLPDQPPSPPPNEDGGSATESAPLPDPLDVLSCLSTNATPDTLSLSASVFELARALLMAVATSAAAGVLELPKPLTTALLRLERAWRGDLDPPAHLFYAELLMERSAMFHRKSLVAAAAAGEGRGDVRNSPPTRGRPSLSDLAQRAAQAQDPSQHIQDATTALEHACAHLAKFRTCCMSSGSTLQAAAEFIRRAAGAGGAPSAAATGAAAPTSAMAAPAPLAGMAATAVARNWALRALWLGHRAAVLRGDPAEAKGWLEACREALEADGAAEAEVPWCPMVKRISLASVTLAEQHINVQALLADLPAALERDGYRRVFQEASLVFLPTANLPASPTASLFPSGRAHSQALAKLFGALVLGGTALQSARDEAGMAGAGGCPESAEAPAGAGARAGAGLGVASRAGVEAGPGAGAGAPAGAGLGTEGHPVRARLHVNSELVTAVGNLSETETLWLRVTYGLEYLRALLPLECTVAKAPHLTLDRAVPVQTVLVRLCTFASLCISTSAFFYVPGLLTIY
jgi:hypothetical protein